MKNRAIILAFICGIIFTGCSTREITAKRYDVNTQNTTNATKSYNETTTDIPEKTTEQIKEKMLDVPVICQYPEFPTGCESATAVMVLRYYDADITATEFARNWLECDDDFYWSDNVLYGPDPDEVFVGTPFSKSSYGCFVQPIVNAVNDNSLECTAEKITGKSLNELCEEYINRNKPLLIWATMGMKASKNGRTWRFDDGSEFTWIAGEHCLVLVGYNEDCYFLNDPQTGETASYAKDIAEQRFAELGSQAVYINRNDH